MRPGHRQDAKTQYKSKDCAPAAITLRQMWCQSVATSFFLMGLMR